MRVMMVWVGKVRMPLNREYLESLDMVRESRNRERRRMKRMMTPWRPSWRV